MAVIFTLALAGAAVAGLAGAANQPSSSAGDGSGALASAAAEQHRLDAADLKVVKRSTVKLPLTGASFTEAKVFDSSTRLTYGVALDSAGNTVDSAAAQKKELAAYRARYGTMTPDLSRRAAAAAPDQLIDVGFYLKSNAQAVVNRANIPDSAAGPAAIEAVKKADAASDARVEAAVADAVGPFVADLKSGGNAVTAVGTISPAVFAR